MRNPSNEQPHLHFGTDFLTLLERTIGLKEYKRDTAANRIASRKP